MHTSAKFTQLKCLLFDVDGTLYHQNSVRIRMLLDLIFQFFLNPKLGYQTLQTIRLFRENREKLRWSSPVDRSLFELQYSQIASKMEINANSIKEIIAEWILKRPLKYLKKYRRPGIVNLLNWCKEKHIAVGAFSDYPTQAKIEALGLESWFEYHLCSTDTEINAFKPSPKGILVACEKCQVKPTELLYIGDRYDIDQAAAVAAGAQFILIGNGNDKEYPKAADFNSLLNFLRF